MKTQTMKTLVLIDGHSLAYRMYYALEHTRMANSKKHPTWAVYGFFNALFALLKETQPDAIAISFDVSRITFRNDLYPEYKAHRDKMPDEMREQMQMIRTGVERLGIPIYELQNYEADDVIGTLAKKGAAEGWCVRILTGDQDSFQLVNDGGNGCAGKVEILIPGRSTREGLKIYDREAVHKKWRVWPEQVTDYKGLRGDTSDNIPGIPGVGEKTAVKLLSEYPTLEQLYDNLDQLPKNKLLEKLVNFQDQAFLSKKLATIDLETPIDVNFEDCHLVIPDLDALMAFFHECEFKQFIKQAPTVLAPFVNGDGESIQQVLALQGAEHVRAESPAAPVTQAALEKLAEGLKVPHTIVATTKQLQDMLQLLETTGVFALDIETSGLDVFNDTLVGIAISVAPGWFKTERRQAVNILRLEKYPDAFQSLALDAPDGDDTIRTFYIPVGHEDTHENKTDQLERDDVLAALTPLLTSPETVIIVHNAKFELNVFERLGIPFNGLVFDTMIASYVYLPETRHGLKSLGFEQFHYQMREITDLIGRGKKQIPFSRVAVMDACEYAACDSYVTLKLARRFLEVMNDDQLTLFYEIEMPLAHVLADMERTGVALDTGYLGELSKTLDTQLAQVEKTIHRLAGVEFNINSPKQVGEILFDRLGITPLRKTKGKTGYSTDVKVLEQLVDEHEIIGHILEYRQLFKLKSTYIDTLPTLINPATGRVHTSFNQTVTATGRLSSSSPNLQNIPIRTDLGRLIRKAFIPGHENRWVLISADYSQIELRLLAHFSEDKNLVEAFRNGEDIHRATAALVFGISKDAVSREMRYKAKAVNFGVIYGQTAHGLSQALKIPRAEAAEFIDRYFHQYKGVKRFIEEVKADAHKTGKVGTICNRVRDLSEGLKNSNRNIREFSERAAFNTPLQGSAADLMKVAMIRLNRALHETGLRSRMILQVHDELVLEAPDDELEHAVDLVKWAMELGQPLKVPLVVDIHTGPTWMES